MKTEREKLQGKWKLVSTEEKGKEAAAVGNVVVVIDGDKWVIEIENQFKKIKEKQDKVSMTFMIDPTQNPKTIDLIRTAGGGGQGREKHLQTGHWFGEDPSR